MGIGIEFAFCWFCVRPVWLWVELEDEEDEECWEGNTDVPHNAQQTVLVFEVEFELAFVVMAREMPFELAPGWPSKPSKAPVCIGTISRFPLCIAARTVRRESQLREGARSRRIVGSLETRSVRLDTGKYQMTYESSFISLARNGSPNNINATNTPFNLSSLNLGTGAAPRGRGRAGTVSHSHQSQLSTSSYASTSSSSMYSTTSPVAPSHINIGLPSINATAGVNTSTGTTQTQGPVYPLCTSSYCLARPPCLP